MNKLLLILIFIAPDALVMAQITITGSILNEEDSTELAGASIIELGTSNSVVADLNGNYKITVSDTATFLEFNYIGFVTRKIPVNGQTIINTSLKPYVIYEAFDQKIGLYLKSGLLNTPYGVNFYFITPVVSPFSVGIQVGYLTDFKLNHRFDAGFSLSGYRFQLGSWAWFYGYVDLNYRKMTIQNAIDLVSFSVENIAKIYNNTVILGLGKIDHSSENAVYYSGYGIIAGYKKEFRKLDYLSLTYKMGFYKQAIEYHLQIDAPFKRVKTFVAYNNIDCYREILIGIGFKTTYYYRYQRNANKYATQNGQ